MSLIEQIVIILVATHLVTIVSFYILKQANSSEKLRSSKQHPANMGKTALQVGGLVIIPITLISLFAIFLTINPIPIDIQFMFALPVIFLFIIGLIDDLKPISAPIRLAIHFANAITITVLVFELTQFSGLSVITDVAGVILPSIFIVLAISWMVNTTNFIDGMDLFLIVNILPGCILFGLLHGITNSDVSVSMIFLVLISSLLGFSWFNRPSATVYMGDAGTLCIGFLIGSCGIYILAKYGSIAGFIPFTYILVDTTLTLFDRLKAGKNLLKSHNGHAYQIAAKNGKSDNTIRSLCFITSIFNTALAYICFTYNHVFTGQVILGVVAFTLSTTVFFYLRQNLDADTQVNH